MVQTEDDDTNNPHCSHCAYEPLKALRYVNKLAKEYAQSAETAYEQGFKRQARIDSQRKKALYGLKRAILDDLVDNGCVDDVAAHRIDGRDYYCFYIDSPPFSFHSPVSEWENPPLDAPDTTEPLDDFESDPDDRADDLDEHTALTRLVEQFDESPNYYVESPFVEGVRGARFVGWSNLPGAVEEGSRVPDRYLSDREGPDSFYFDIGDSFETTEGRCEIVDRYFAYLSPLRYPTPVLQRPVYDVVLDGNRQDCVRERRIEDEWRIIADSIDDPLPNVTGNYTDHVAKALNYIDDSIAEALELGKIIELDPPRTEDQPIYVRLTEVQTNGPSLFCKFEPVGPTDTAPGGRPLDEIASDIAAIHDELHTPD